MGNIFAGSEIVEIGIQIEENGRDFYNALTKQSKDKKAQDVFKYLEGEEEKHITVFQSMLASVQKYEPAESYQGEYLAYMKALASNSVFTQKDKGREAAKKVKTDKEAVELGMGFEKDSIIFYEGMKKLIPGYDAKIVEELIKQEQGHLMQLAELKKTLG